MMWGDGMEMGWDMWLLMVAGTVGFWVLIMLLVRNLLPGQPRGDSQVPDRRSHSGCSTSRSREGTSHPRPSNNAAVYVWTADDPYPHSQSDERRA